MTALFGWFRYAAWVLLGAGFLLLAVNAVWGLPWGPIAVGLLITGYCAGVIAVVPLVGRTGLALFQTLTARLPVAVALGVVAALMVGVTWLVAWAWVASSG